MGAIIDKLYDHEGYALGRLADGTLTGAWTHRVRDITAYVAGCECGWHSRREHPPTEEGEEAAYEQWEREHALVELARQATRHRQDLTRVLAWLGDQADRLHDPATLDRVAGGLDRAHRLVTDVQRDRERQASEREAGGAR
jgi:hypothetical protein